MTLRIAIPLVSALLLALSGPVLAGLAHTGSSLVCSDCHTMHYSMQHSYTGNTTNVITDSIGPFEKLLKASPNDLCLACHNGTGFAPDVLGAPTSDYPRQAGALNRVTPPESNYQTWKGHTLGSTEVAPGGAWANTERGLLCIDCHDEHGIVTQYRNLRTSTEPGDRFENKTLSFAYGSTNNLAKDVFLHDGFDVAYRYGVAGTDFNEPDPTKSAYGNWCTSCHGDFHGSGGTPNMGGASGGDAGNSPWVRHPTADVNIGQNTPSSLVQFQLRANRVKVMSATGNWDAGTDITPSCFSCHKAHGNRNPFGLIYMSGSGTVTEEGDTGGTSPTQLCRQCHTQ
ncbi:MAG: cytochrome c3 family protein [Armatimonadota bacterium]